MQPKKTIPSTHTTYPKGRLMKLNFYIGNVFAEANWGGNPLAIVPLLGAIQLTDEHMQKIASQFNLSETVFITPATQAGCVAHLRIFTPDYELPFAGHPTIGAASWLYANLSLTEQFQLSTPGKIVKVTHNNGMHQFELEGYETAPCGLTHEQLAHALGLSPQDIGDNPLWVNSGTWQLIVPIRSREAVLKARPHVEELRETPIDGEHTHAYIWHEDNNQVSSRFFFDIHGSGVEDPGTGSACANLGAWAHHNGRAPLNWRITQGEVIDRTNHLYLTVDADGKINVGGHVKAFAQGVMVAPT